MDPKFLLVDDDAESRKMVREFLYSFGYESVVEADGVKDAVAALNTESFDVIISDWDMPRATGLSLLKLVKLQERFRQTAFIFLSGAQEQQADHVTRAARLGVDGFLLKPVRASKLKALLNQVLERYRGEVQSAT